MHRRKIMDSSERRKRKKQEKKVKSKEEKIEMTNGRVKKQINCGKMRKENNEE